MKNKSTVKFGLMFKDEAKDFISTAPNIKGYTKEELIDSKPIVFCAYKGLESYQSLIYGDKILSINGKKIKNMYEFYKIKNKLSWNSKVNFSFIRNTQKKDVTIKLKSFNNWKKKFPRLGFDLKQNNNYVEFFDLQMLSSVLPKWTSNTKIQSGDKILSLNNKKITTIKDVSDVMSDFIPNKIMKISVFNENGVINTKIKVISYNSFLKLNREFCSKYWPKKAAEILCKEYENNDFFLSEKYKQKIIKKYEKPTYKKTLLKAANIALKKGRLKLTKKGKLRTKNKSIRLYT